MKNKKMVIMIIILSILVISLTSYIIFDKTSDKKEDSSDNKKTEVIREINEEEKQTLLDQIEVYNNSFSLYYPINDVSKLSNSQLLEFAFTNTRSNYENEYSAKDFNDVISKYFGKNVNFKNENYICKIDSDVLYIYNEQTEKYTYNLNHYGHGGFAFISTISTHFDNATVKNEEEYIVNVKLLYGMHCDEICPPNDTYYATIEDSENSVNEILGNPGTYEEYIITDEDYNKVKDMIPITTFKFIKDKDGNYGLKSVEINKKEKK